MRLTLENLWTIAGSEIRSCRRLVRTKVLIALATLATVGLGLFATLVHTLSSPVAPASGLLGPRFNVGPVFSIALMAYTLCVLFLAFDIRARDVRERIFEVVDSRPFSNFELLAGRLIGIVVLLAIPLAATILLLFFFGLFAQWIGLPFGSPIAVAGVLSFLLWDIIPNLALWGSLTIFLTIVIRVRMVVAVMVVSIVVFFYWISTQLPMSIAPALTTVTGTVSYASEIAPEIFGFETLVSRISVVLFSLGLTCIAAGLLTRGDVAKNRTISMVTGMTSILVGGFGVGGLLAAKAMDSNQFEKWVEVHKQHQLRDEVDILLVSGIVEILPGRSVNLDLTLSVNVDLETDQEAWLFNLNPGYRIKQVSVNGESEESSVFENGLLSIPFDQSYGSPIELRIIASGVPDRRFAYLDGSLDTFELDRREARNLSQLGHQSYVFRRDFVALLPGMSWLPSSGSAFRQFGTETRKMDYFELDLEVISPPFWTVAGPGQRLKVEPGRVRFSPVNAVPNVALIAANFDQRSLVVEGIEFELLFNRGHTKNLELLSPYKDNLVSVLESTIDTLRQAGIEYPYRSFSLVEVPVTLRMYGGGWFMDSARFAPGMFVLRESGFPIARFDNLVKYLAREIEEEASFSRQDTPTVGNEIFAILENYFENDIHGGNLITGLIENSWKSQMSAFGSGAMALNHVINEIVLELTSKSTGYFSPHALANRKYADSMIRSVRFSEFGYEDFDWANYFSDRAHVWDNIRETSFVDFASALPPLNGYHMLLLKGDTLAKTAISVFDRESLSNLMQELIHRFRGNSFTSENFEQVAQDIGLDLGGYLGDWLNQTEFPGFLTDQPTSMRLPDTPDGNPQYQSSFILRNNEPAIGMVRIIQEVDRGGELAGRGETTTQIVRPNTSLQISLHATVPIVRAWIYSEGSLNRGPLRVDFPAISNDQPIRADKLPPATPVDWVPYDLDGVIVDDLDASFSIAFENPEAEVVEIPKFIQFFLGSPSIELDNGLPRLQTDEWGYRQQTDPMDSALWYEGKGWFRENIPSSFGMYRRTVASSRSGTKNGKPTFEAKLPEAGPWTLAYHLPPIYTQHRDHVMRMVGPGRYVSGNRVLLGKHQISIHSADEKFEVELNAEETSAGWVELGSFNLESTDVSVVLDDVIEGFGMADAVRWTRAVEAGE